MTIKMIACVNEVGYLGKDGDLLFNIKKDLQNFKKLTEHNIVLMGHSTWKSLPVKPLKNRVNVVLSSQNLKLPQGVFLAHSKEQILNNFLESNRNERDKDLYICGGQRLYEEFLDYTDIVYLTRVKDDVTEGDTIFPLHKMQINFELMKLDSYIEDGIEFTIEEWVSEGYKDEWYKLNSEVNKKDIKDLS